IRLAATSLEVSVDDLEWSNGQAVVRGAPGRRFSFGQLAALAAAGSSDSGESRGLDAIALFRPPTVTFAGGVHAAMVEVDPATAAVRVLDYAVAHDCGRQINPLL